MSALILFGAFTSGLCLGAGAYRWKFGLDWKAHIFFAVLNAALVALNVALRSA